MFQYRVDFRGNNGCVQLIQGCFIRICEFRILFLFFFINPNRTDRTAYQVLKTSFFETSEHSVCCDAKQEPLRKLGG